jgi:hypothetical protein
MFEKPEDIFQEIERAAPEDLLYALSAVGDTLEQMAWKAGWLTDHLYNLCRAKQVEADYFTVCYYVAAFRLRGQRSPNTVKAWALTARFFSQEVALQYHYDIVPMTIFTLAASFRDQVNPKTQNLYWQDALDYAFEEYQNLGTGRCPSRAKVLNYLTGEEIITRGLPITAGTNLLPGIAEVQPGDEMDVASGEGMGESEVAVLISGFAQAIRQAQCYVPMLAKYFPKAEPVIQSAILQLIAFANQASEKQRRKKSKNNGHISP